MEGWGGEVPREKPDRGERSWIRSQREKIFPPGERARGDLAAIWGLSAAAAWNTTDRIQQERKGVGVNEHGISSPLLSLSLSLSLPIYIISFSHSHTSVHASPRCHCEREAGAGSRHQRVPHQFPTSFDLHIYRCFFSFQRQSIISLKAKPRFYVLAEVITCWQQAVLYFKLFLLWFVCFRQPPGVQK